MKRFQCLLAGLLLCCTVDACAIELVTEDNLPRHMPSKDGKLAGVVAEKLEDACRRAGVSAYAGLMPCVRTSQAVRYPN
jgi:hypothetical protein